jgi:RNA polymerase sigma-70 factor, ECF subfamily
MSIDGPDSHAAAGAEHPAATRRPERRAATGPDASGGAPARGADTNEVVRHIRGGDEQRFTELYERVAPALFAWVHLRLGAAARRQLDPEDVVQEIWMRALRAFPRFDPERGPFRGWIFQITKYELLDTFRGLASGAQIGEAADARDSSERMSQLPDQVTSFTRRLARDESLQQLLVHVAALPEEEHSLVVHCGLEGRPASEVAVLLGLTHEATRKRWLRLRADLRERVWVHELFADSVA